MLALWQGLVANIQSFMRFHEAALEAGLLCRAFQLLEYQMVLWVCRFDTLGKLVSAHRAGVPTTPWWWVTPGWWLSAAAAEPYAPAATHHSGVNFSPLDGGWLRPHRALGLPHPPTTQG